MEKAPVLVHVHVPKTAGTAVRTWLNRAYPASFGLFFTQFVFTDETLEMAGIGEPDLRIAASHTIRTFHPIVGDRRLYYFTLLRNPVTHVLSFARYMVQVKDESNGQAAYQGDFESLSTRECVERTLDRPAGLAFTENAQTNFFALYPWCEQNAKTRGCDPAKYSEWADENREAYRRERLEVAKQVLSSFVAVGTVERLHDSLELLRARAAPLGFALRPASEVGVENVTTVPLDDLSWLNENDPVGRRLGASINEDVQLWNFVQQGLPAAASAT